MDRSYSLDSHLSLSGIFLGRFSWLHLVSAHRKWMEVFANRITLVCLCVGVLNSSFILLSCSGCLVCLTCIICEIKAKSLYSCCFVGCYFQDVVFLQMLMSRLVHQRSSTNMGTAYAIKANQTWEKFLFYLPRMMRFLYVDKLSIEVHGLLTYIWHHFQ